MAPLKEKVGRIVLESHGYTRALYDNHPAVAEVIKPGTLRRPMITGFVPRCSPGLFWEECGAAPNTAYLTADAEKAEKWRQRFAAEPGFKVGLVWARKQGTFVNDHVRSTRTALLCAA